MTISQTASRISIELEMETGEFALANERFLYNKLEGLLKQTSDPAEIEKIQDLIAESLEQRGRILKSLNYNKELLQTL